MPEKIRSQCYKQFFRGEHDVAVTTAKFSRQDSENLLHMTDVETIRLLLQPKIAFVTQQSYLRPYNRSYLCLQH